MKRRPSSLLLAATTAALLLAPAAQAQTTWAFPDGAGGFTLHGRGGTGWAFPYGAGGYLVTPPPPERPVIIPRPNGGGAHILDGDGGNGGGMVFVPVPVPAAPQIARTPEQQRAYEALMRGTAALDETECRHGGQPGAVWGPAWTPGLR